MKEIKLDLHKVENALVLDSGDIYEYVSEIKQEDIELSYYIDKWCKYLNYYIDNDHNKEMLIEDAAYARLDAWLDGYSFAKKYEVEHESSKITIRTNKYLIVLARPFEI